MPDEIAREPEYDMAVVDLVLVPQLLLRDALLEPFEFGPAGKRLTFA